jgi:hypothetical protein
MYLVRTDSEYCCCSGCCSGWPGSLHLHHQLHSAGLHPASGPSWVSGGRAGGRRVTVGSLPASSSPSTALCGPPPGIWPPSLHVTILHSLHIICCIVFSAQLGSRISLRATVTVMGRGPAGGPEGRAGRSEIRSSLQ